MKVSKKAYYGLRAMVALAQNSSALSTHALASAEGLPEDYLEKILQSLKRAELVDAKKGTSGGYFLSRDLKKITAWEVLAALDGGFRSFEAPHLSRTSPYPKVTHCQTNGVWKKLGETIEETLSQMTLHDLIPAYVKKGPPLK